MIAPARHARPLGRRQSQVFEFRITIDLNLPGQESQVQRVIVPVSAECGGHIAEFQAELPQDSSPIVTSNSFDRPSVSNPKPIKTPAETLTLVGLYSKHLRPAELLKNEVKTVNADVARIQRFQDWIDSRETLETGDTRNTAPRVPYLQHIRDHRDVLYEYARFMRHQASGSSAATVTQSLNAIMKLLRWCQDFGSLSKLPKCPTKGDINLMRSTLLQDDAEFSGEPVTVADVKRMLDPAVLAGCTWPILGNVEPSKFWELVLISHFVLGFRTQDWFAARTQAKSGLLWSDVITAPKCPRLEDVENTHGWANFLVHKTKKKSQRADKPQKLLVPLPCRIREMIELFRGIDPERVFPVPHSSKSWSMQFRGILERAGMDDASRRAQRKPVIRLSEGKRNIASFRKGCASMWADHVSETAATYMLKHSVAVDGVSAVTREHYLQMYRPLKDIVRALETLPLW